MHERENLTIVTKVSVNAQTVVLHQNFLVWSLLEMCYVLNSTSGFISIHLF